ncbi:MAG: formylglycine-generating enzyme family protein [Planctomycetaceae bacterium]|nr:formylglycine-generating enzyme family protein [Planctomycetaceae bacterium]
MKTSPSLLPSSIPTLLLVLSIVACAVVFLMPKGNRLESPAPDAPAQANEESPERPPITEPNGPTPEGMVWIPGGTFQMGTRDFPQLGEPNIDKIKPDETPVHEVTVDGFWMDTTEVTNAEFARFVDATGYVTFAEITPKREDFIGLVPDIAAIPEENLVAGALIFNEDFDRENFVTGVQNWEYQAWKYQKGADWRHPTGPESSIEGKMDHPVVNVVYKDCLAYCKWAGKRLPTEAEWEYACRGGAEQQRYYWGEELIVDGKYQCNYWQGDFPVDRQNLDGYLDSSPVKSFPPNPFGLYDMSGNVWEWVHDYYHRDYYTFSPKFNPQGPDKWFDPDEPHVEKRVTRGGSFMCNTNNCTGYRNAARMRSDVTSACFHTGFRCAIDTKMMASKP